MIAIARAICFALSVLLITPCSAQTVDNNNQYVQGYAGYYKKSDNSGPYAIGPNGVATLLSPYNSYFLIGGGGNYAIKNSAGKLAGLYVTKAAASSTIIVYDNSSATGNIVAVIDGSVTGSYPFNVATLNGLYVVVVGGSPNVTIAWQ